MLRAAAMAEELLNRVSGTMTGQIRVGLIPTLTRSVLSEAMLRFADNYPMVHLSLVEAYSFQLTEAVGREELILQWFHPLKDIKTFVPNPWERIRSFWWGPPGEDHLQPVELRKQKPLRYVLPSLANTRRQRIDAYFAHQHIQAAGILELDAMFGTIDLVARSDWHTILPGIMCAADLDGQRRRLQPIIKPELSVTYSRIEPAAKPLNQAAEAFRPNPAGGIDKNPRRDACGNQMRRLNIATQNQNFTRKALLLNMRARSRKRPERR